MVSKCANPGCSAPFLYMRKGKLFLIENLSRENDNHNHKDPASGMNSIAGRSTRRLEFFWLCDDCAPVMTVTVKPDHGVVVQPRVQAAVAASS